MPAYSATIEEQLTSGTVRCALLVELAFTTSTTRLWQGFGPLTAGGYTWQGAGTLGEIEGLEAAINGSAPEATLRLSGVDADVLALAVGEASEFARRPVRIYAQFFSAAWATLDTPLALWSGLMHSLEIDRSAEARAISLRAETLFTGRRRPPYSFYTDRDQQGRYSGDRYCERVPALINAQVTWPDF